MIKDKKILGLCMTQINSTSSVELVDRLGKEALAAGYKLIVFNSPLELEWNYDNERGMTAVFDAINFDIVDALLIEYLTFRNEIIIRSLIERAKLSGTPVIMLNGRFGDCHSVTDEYTDSYKALMDHVIKEHGVRDTMYMAGREGFDESEELKCVIGLGADLIQGYYTGKAKPDPLDDIPQSIKQEIASYREASNEE